MRVLLWKFKCIKHYDTHGELEILQILQIDVHVVMAMQGIQEQEHLIWHHHNILVTWSTHVAGYSCGSSEQGLAWVGALVSSVARNPL